MERKCEVVEFVINKFSKLDNEDDMDLVLLYKDKIGCE